MLTRAGQRISRVRTVAVWCAAVVAVFMAAVFLLVVCDKIGLVWSCEARLGTVGAVLAWTGVLHHVVCALWILLVWTYPARYIGRRRRAAISVCITVHFLVVLWTVATSC